MPGLDENALLLLHCDGEDNGTVLTDSSDSDLTVTVVGPAITDVDDKVFGTAALHCLNTIVDNIITEQGYASVAYEAALALSGGAFTVDFRFKVDEILYGRNATFLNIGAGAILVVVSAPSGTPRLSVTGSACWLDFSAYDNNAWHHVAIVGSAGTIKVYIDGLLVDTDAAATLWSSASTDPWLIGENTVGIEVGGTTPANGVHIDEFRYSNIARWTDEFTPPTGEYTTDDINEFNVVLSHLELSMLGGAAIAETLPNPEALMSNGFQMTCVLGNLTAEMYTGAYIAESLPAVANDLVSTLPNICAMSATLSRVAAVMHAGIHADVELPGLTADMRCLARATANLSLNLPSVGMDMLAGAVLAETLSSVVGLMASTTIYPAHLTISLPAVQNDIHAAVGSNAALVSDLPVLSVDIRATLVSVGGLSATLPGLNIVMTGRVHSINTLDVSLPALSGQMTSVHSILAALSVALPSLQSLLFSPPSAYETFCMNLVKTTLLSKFTNFSFNSFATINNRPVAFSSSGLFALEGDSDNGSIIPAVVATPALDFGSYLMKKVYGTRIGGRVKGRLTLTVSDGVSSWPTTLDFGSIQSLQNKMGYYTHYTRGKYLTLTLTNPDGSQFLLNDISLYLQLLER